MCGTSGDVGRFVNFILKRGGVAFKNERGVAERHHYFNNREKSMEEKDLTFFKFCILISTAFHLKMSSFKSYKHNFKRKYNFFGMYHNLIS